VIGLAEAFPALIAAALFGLGTVASKALLRDLPPVMLAGLLYLGSGLGLGAIRALRPETSSLSGKRLERPDAPWLLGAVLCGGVVGPVLLMFGLAATTASSASLLLTFEAPFTALLAWTIFGERASVRLALGLVLVVLGAVVLSLPEPGSLSAARWTGSLLVAGACLAWGFDNNFTQRISGKDPISIAAIKGLGAGLVNVAIALCAGASPPPASSVLKAGLLGFLCYGVSLACFILSLRRIGSARTSLYCALAPFFGAAAGIVLLREPPGARLATGAAFMAAGIFLAARHPSGRRSLPAPRS
jgi:drug/metabolite transporter (DMT)-like permease